MAETSKSLTVTLPDDNNRLAELCGQFDENIKQIESRLGVSIARRGNLFSISGDPGKINHAEKVVRSLYEDTAQKASLSAEKLHLALREKDSGWSADEKDTRIKTRKGYITGRNDRQRRYLHNILTHDVNFGIGPAGTGKTYLAVACAVQALEERRVSRIVLVRPAVEAGEKLGFLPGDLEQKVDPYLRPLYDALYEMLGFEKVARMIEKSVIEIAPLAFMRGRTLNESFIILDEAQNATGDQMKMLLTRIGFGSVAVITGDPTQIDLPKGQRSGLIHAVELLKKIPEISVVRFQSEDVVRHDLVQKIVEAYESETSKRIPE